VHDDDRPFPNCYLVPRAPRFWAGEYPWARAGEPAGPEKLAALGRFGVQVIIDLTRADDGLDPYASHWLAGGEGRGHEAFPIPDLGVPRPAEMAALLARLAELAPTTGLYLHCWGGVGRTGTVVACWLIERGYTPDEALDEVGRLFATMSPAKVRRFAEGSPQTAAQRQFVREWPAARKRVQRAARRREQAAREGAERRSLVLRNEPLPMIAAWFRRKFVHWGLELPVADLAERQAGAIAEQGWYIQYRFGVSRGVEYLDYYAAHRMTSDEHRRIYATGRTRALPVIRAGYFYSPDDSEEERRRIEAAHWRYNRRISRMLDAKGFTGRSINMALRAGDIE
jgi:hypothetical protein